MPKFKQTAPVQNTPIEINGETYQLRYDFTAFRKAEIELTKFWGQRTTIPGLLGSIFNNTEDTQILSDKISVSDVCVLLWCGLLHDDPTLTLETVANGLELADLATVLPVIIEAIGKSMSKAQPETAQEQPAKNEETPQA